MGARKKISADARKEANKTLYFAKLNDVPTSPRKNAPCGRYDTRDR